MCKITLLLFQIEIQKEEQVYEDEEDLLDGVLTIMSWLLLHAGRKRTTQKKFW